MSKDGRFVLGILIVFGAIIAYALLADAAKGNGWLVWLIVAVIAIGLIAPAIWFKGYRAGLIQVGTGALNSLGSLFEGKDGKSIQDPEADLHKRKPVPPALRNQVIGRANGRCQAPKCHIMGRKNLCVHHINMNPSESYDIDNLIALCQEHHQQVHHPQGGVPIRQVRDWSQGLYRERSPER